MIGNAHTVRRNGANSGGRKPRNEKAMRRLPLYLATLAVGATVALPAQASPTTSAVEPNALARAQAIRAEIGARYRLLAGRKLAVTEATTTGVIESFSLLSANLQETRVVPADNGIYFAICPRGAICPYPAIRLARPAEDLLPRRIALELAVRVFLETSAEVVAVSLPTPRFVLVIVEREDLAREVELRALAAALGTTPPRPLAPSLRRVVDRVTRPRVFLPLGLEPTPTGRDTLGCMPRWPSLSVGTWSSARLREPRVKPEHRN